MRRISVSPSSRGKPVTPAAIRRYGSEYGLELYGWPTTTDIILNRVRWVVEDWRDNFDEKRVSLHTVTAALASDAQVLATRLMVAEPVLTLEDYLESAEWFLSYALTHLHEGSGLRVVKNRRTR